MPDLKLLHDSGTSDMGSMDFLVGTDVNRVARWPVDAPDMALAGLRVRFATVPGEGGTGVNPLTIRVDSHRGSAFDMTLHTIVRRGIGADVNFRVAVDQLDHFYVEIGDEIVLIWTNPDDGKIEWGAAVALTRRNVSAPR